MKSILTLAVLALVASSSFATTAVDAEWDWNHQKANAGNTNHSNYGYVGIIQSTEHYGVFDFGLQGTSTQYYGFSNDKSNGYEAGYSYPFAAGPVTIVPRIAHGSMNHINPDGTGFNYNAKYWLPSVEVDYPLNKLMSSYVATSRMLKANADSVKYMQREQFGIDWTLSKEFTLRTGGSINQVYQSGTQLGTVVIGTYTF